MPCARTTPPRKPDGPADRVAPRRLVSIACIVSSSALGHVRAEASNLSRIGCRIEMQCRLHRGDFVMLAIPSFSPIGARVAWSTGTASGVEFLQPVNIAVLDHLLALYGPDQVIAR